MLVSSGLDVAQLVAADRVAVREALAHCRAGKQPLFEYLGGVMGSVVVERGDIALGDEVQACL